MNINTENYEAYLLDYMEGQLNAEETAQLKAFVATQGLDWSELTEPLPHLEAPQMAYESKKDLKKKRAIVPLYVKMAGAAAAAGLLLTVTLWPEKQLPKVESIAELNPIEATHIDVAPKISVLPARPIHFVKSQIVAKEEPVVPEKKEVPLVAELPTKSADAIQANHPLVNFEKPDFDLLAYHMSTDLVFALMTEADDNHLAHENEEVSMIGKAFFWMTKGQHTSLGSLIGSGVRKAKQDLTEAATDFVLAAYQHADEQFEEVKERWEEKHEE